MEFQYHFGFNPSDSEVKIIFDEFIARMQFIFCKLSVDVISPFINWVVCSLASLGFLMYSR